MFEVYEEEFEKLTADSLGIAFAFMPHSIPVVCVKYTLLSLLKKKTWYSVEVRPWILPAPWPVEMPVASIFRPTLFSLELFLLGEQKKKWIGTANPI